MELHGRISLTHKNASDSSRAQSTRTLPTYMVPLQVPQALLICTNRELGHGTNPPHPTWKSWLS